MADTKGHTFDTTAAAVSINIGVGMMQPLGTSHSERKTKGQLSKRHSCVLMWASATVWSGTAFPPRCPVFTAANLSVGEKRSSRTLSSAPFTKQPLWSGARIRMIMWTPVYQQAPLQLQHTAAAVWAPLHFTCVHIRCWSETACQSDWKKSMRFLKNDLNEFLQFASESSSIIQTILTHMYNL